MRMRRIFAISLVLLLPVVGKTEERKYIEDTTVPFIQFCELLQNPQKYDGHLVRTEAVWQRMIHSGALADRVCSRTSSELLLVLPSFSQDSNYKSRLRKKLWKLLDKEGAARVRIVGIFRGPKDRPYAAEGQDFQLEIKCLLSAEPLESNESQSDVMDTHFSIARINGCPRFWGPFIGSAGVSPAKLLKSMSLSFFINAGETPALPVANRWTASSGRTQMGREKENG
jgi:hypothetical protein